jgi:hypothetical protein
MAVKESGLWRALGGFSPKPCAFSGEKDFYASYNFRK